MNHDVIASAGAPGLSLAVVRYPGRRTALVVDARSSRNTPAVHLHGDLSRDGMPTDELLAAGNIVEPGAQVRTYAGSAIAIAINADLMDEGVPDAIHDVTNGFTLTPTTNNHQESA